jgi:hypothetical protein
MQPIRWIGGVCNQLNQGSTVYYEYSSTGRDPVLHPMPLAVTGSLDGAGTPNNV